MMTLKQAKDVALNINTHNNPVTENEVIEAFSRMVASALAIKISIDPNFAANKKEMANFIEDLFDIKNNIKLAKDKANIHTLSYRVGAWLGKILVNEGDSFAYAYDGDNEPIKFKMEVTQIMEETVKFDSEKILSATGGEYTPAIVKDGPNFPGLLLDKGLTYCPAKLRDYINNGSLKESEVLKNKTKKVSYTIAIELI